MSMMQREPQRTVYRTPEPEPRYEYDHEAAARREAVQQKERDEAALREREEAVRREKEEARRKAQEEAERRQAAILAHEKLVASDYSYVQDQWQVFQRTRHDAPPTLLPLEAVEELATFRAFLAQESLRSLENEATEKFEREITSQAQEGRSAVETLEHELLSTSHFAGLLKSLGFGKLREILRKCKISIKVPNLGSPAREAIASACKFLRKPWSKRLSHTQQAMFSIHRSAGTNVIHIGSSLFGSVFVTVPNSLQPEALAEALLSEIKTASSKLIRNDSTIAVIDGDHQEINFQKIFDRSIVVRSMKDDCDRFASNLDTLLEREPPTSDNTALHFGVPASEEELHRVFRSGGASWDVWNSVAPLWHSRANAHGFDRLASASKEQVLESLANEKNVIVVVAHADQRTIYMPAPPPEGSQLTAADLIERKADIMANKPVVYLFCCETAEISNLSSFSAVLLDCGAAAVIAPQTKIDAELCVDFFDGVVEKTSPRPESALTKIATAQRKSKYREMETYVG
jgi:hypothetical protein